MTFVNSSCFNFYQLFLQNFDEKTELILFLVVPHEENFPRVVRLETELIQFFHQSFVEKVDKN